MPITGVKIKGLSCFTTEFCGFDEFKLINVIIGRNNTGKSQLLRLLSSICSIDRSKDRLPATYQFEGNFEEEELRRFFQQNHAGGSLRGNHWVDHGRRFVGAAVSWVEGGNQQVVDVSAVPSEFDQHGRPSSYQFINEVAGYLEGVVSRLCYPYSGRNFRHILADRDIRNEMAGASISLESDGQGATNIVRDHLIRADDIMVTRSVIQVELRGALNHIFGPDGEFSSISVQQHSNGDWEIFLEEAGKGLIPLSSSGSGLKTVFLVLLNLLVIPKIERKAASDYVFAFEELENNLHPALLRRLLRFVDDFVTKHQCPVFLTTHSSATLDQFSRSEHAQFVRVSHDGKAATTQTISAHFDHSQVVGDLGARASDILQANGIIWVEGPSDAIYLNHWIEIFSKGELLEGRDYACAFYGGSLLARTSFADPTEPNPRELIQMIRLNRNAALICDSDKSSKGSRLKPRVLKAQEEMRALPNGYMWITDGKEIETYLPGSVIASVLGLKAVTDDPAQFELFFPSEDKSKKGGSYVEAKLNRSSLDKVELALASREHATLTVMEARFDWAERMQGLVEVIRRWNE